MKYLFAIAAFLVVVIYGSKLIKKLRLRMWDNERVDTGYEIGGQRVVYRDGRHGCGCYVAAFVIVLGIIAAKWVLAQFE